MKQLDNNVDNFLSQSEWNQLGECRPGHDTAQGARCRMKVVGAGDRRIKMRGSHTRDSAEGDRERD